jgi:hypothetical protein
LILVSGGHHEQARGARYKYFTEWPETLRWRDEIVRTIGHRADIIPTGTLHDKVRYINERSPALAVEIHFNSAIARGKHVGQGCECLYKPDGHRSRHAAQQVQMYLAEIFPPSRGIKEGWYRMDFPGRVDYDGDVDGDEKLDYFLAATDCPAIIIEPEFIHNIDLIYRNMGVGCMTIANALVNVMADWDT